MKGARPLNNEGRLVSACFDGTFEARNRGLFMIGVSTGGRISELLSLQIDDVYQKQIEPESNHAVGFKDCLERDSTAASKKATCLIFANLIHSINPVLGGITKRTAQYICHPPAFVGDNGLETGRSK